MSSFFFEFANRPDLVQEWTIDRRAISRAVARVTPAGGTAMYDAIAEALPMAGIGRHSKKAILVISDGNDTNSRLSIGELRQLIRESEVLVYALGVDGTAVTVRTGPTIHFLFRDRSRFQAEVPGVASHPLSEEAGRACGPRNA